MHSVILPCQGYHFCEITSYDNPPSSEKKLLLSRADPELATGRGPKRFVSKLIKFIIKLLIIVCTSFQYKYMSEEHKLAYSCPRNCYFPY